MIDDDPGDPFRPGLHGEHDGVPVGPGGRR
jgi:hypothetical protein